MKGAWRKLTASLRRRGFSSTLGLLARRATELPQYWVDRQYDRVHGTRTTEVVPLRELVGDDDPRSATGSRYEATGVKTVRQLLTLLKPPTGVGFVDYGCGHGRVLLLAADYGFEHVTGVEFVPALAETARANISAYSATAAASSRFDVQVLDAAHYVPRETDSVFYFFNPFPGDVFDAVLDRIQDSHRLRPRRMWLLYHNPVWKDVLDRRDAFELTGTHRFQRYEVRVYEAR